MKFRTICIIVTGSIIIFAGVKRSVNSRVIGEPQPVSEETAFDRSSHQKEYLDYAKAEGYNEQDAQKIGEASAKLCVASGSSDC
jgi:hypothetical protein